MTIYPGKAGPRLSPAAHATADDAAAPHFDVKRDAMFAGSDSEDEDHVRPWEIRFGRATPVGPTSFMPAPPQLPMIVLPQIPPAPLPPPAAPPPHTAAALPALLALPPSRVLSRLSAQQIELLQILNAHTSPGRQMTAPALRELVEQYRVLPTSNLQMHYPSLGGVANAVLRLSKNRAGFVASNSTGGTRRFWAPGLIAQRGRQPSSSPPAQSSGMQSRD